MGTGLHPLSVIPDVGNRGSIRNILPDGFPMKNVGNDGKDSGHRPSHMPHGRRLDPRRTGEHLPSPLFVKEGKSAHLASALEQGLGAPGFQLLNPGLTKGGMGGFETRPNTPRASLGREAYGRKSPLPPLCQRGEVGAPGGSKGDIL